MDVGTIVIVWVVFGVILLVGGILITIEKRKTHRYASDINRLVTEGLSPEETAQNAKEFYAQLKPSDIRALTSKRTKAEAERYLRKRWADENVGSNDAFFLYLISTYWEPAREAHESTSLAATLDGWASRSGDDSSSNSSDSSHGATGTWADTAHFTSHDSSSSGSSYDGGSSYSSSDSGGGSDGGGGGGGD